MTRPDATTSPPSAERRRAARVLVLDPANRVLLLRGYDPARPEHRYWFTVGGGLDPGETGAEAAARELFEETGLRLTPAEMGVPVWRDHTEFPFDGRWYRQEQEFFAVRVPAFEVDFAGHNAIERRSVDAHRWWTPDELRTTSERYYPTDLPDLLGRLEC
jgi:8-oxo-dGTP pyrophosphatase MutT (NUDIX family)